MMSVPLSVATITAELRPMKRPLSTTPTVILVSRSVRCGSSIGPKWQSMMKLPPSVTKGSPPACRNSAVAPSFSSAAAVACQPNCVTSTGTGMRSPSRRTSFSWSTTTMKRALAAATIFSRKRAPPWPLIKSRVEHRTSSAPSIARSIRRCSAKLVSGMPSRRAKSAVCSEVGMATTASPRVTREASSSTTKPAVEPVPRPTIIPLSTNSTAR